MNAHRCLASFPGKVIIMQKSHARLAIVLSGLALLAAGNTARAGDGGFFCHCPPPLKWCSESAPSIKFKCGCARPVCDPCSLQHYGYYATCWQPWPYPADYSHCQTPPPGALLPPPAYPPYTPRAPQDRRDTIKDEELPKPRAKDPKDQMDTPQVRTMGYRAFEEPAAVVAPVAPVTQPRTQPTTVRFVR